ncbi:hypothetical protein SISSUDRAFT_1041616 [Sistotremastrum suecicum HHB10207 ss-3]|uniref:Uncharacterized protein n=1 Tax=Sistotremastrum suecicum HHB10207 ss-3 TaxID=1314776 RepID=A0A166H446_9AGAM|nr:hypothetical protein SISSUDRAFT_1041616 [Sistotremastrum suecicum HHB10207 ss-3]
MAIAIAIEIEIEIEFNAVSRVARRVRSNQEKSKGMKERRRWKEEKTTLNARSVKLKGSNEEFRKGERQRRREKE